MEECEEDKWRLRQIYKGPEKVGEKASSIKERVFRAHTVSLFFSSVASN